MDILNKHYEKIILVVCLMLMVLGLMKVGGIVRQANEDLDHDDKTRQSKIDESRGDMVADFDPKLFVSKEGWIQRVKTNKPAKVRQISEIVAEAEPDPGKKNAGTDKRGEAIIKAWDRRYFNILTRHSLKPIEEAEANYRLEKNKKELESLKKSIDLCKDAIKRRIAESGDEEDDTKLAELRLQLDGFQALLANAEMDILELNKRKKYISMFCTPQGSLVDPQEVVCCPNQDCGALMLSSEDKCPFCGTAMPIVNPAENEGKDSDQDGMPDSFERAHRQKKGFLTADVQRQLGLQGGEQGGGTAAATSEKADMTRVLNPFDAGDASQDFDGDSFTNLEEYAAGTDLDDPESFPPPAAFVRLVEFKRDKFPVRFMGVREGRTGSAEERIKNGRAKLSFMRNYRAVSNSNRIGVREYWNTNEDYWENVRVGKKFEAPDGKSYVVDELGVEDSGGRTRTYVKLSEYIRPVRRRPARGKEPEPEAKPAEPAHYTLYEGEDGYYEDWYAHLIFLVDRSYASLPGVYNNRYRITSGARNHFIKTRFKLVEGETLTVQLPFAEIRKEPKRQQDKRPRLNRFESRNDREADRSSEWRSSPELNMKTFAYKVSKFDRDKKTLVLSWGEGKDAKTVTVKPFREDETVQLPDSRKFPLFYQGGGRGGGTSMDQDYPNDFGEARRR